MRGPSPPKDLDHTSFHLLPLLSNKVSFPSRVDTIIELQIDDTSYYCGQITPVMNKPPTIRSCGCRSNFGTVRYLSYWILTSSQEDCKCKKSDYDCKASLRDCQAHRLVDSMRSLLSIFKTVMLEVAKVWAKKTTSVLR